MAVLPTNYKNAVLDTDENPKRRYEMTENADGTVSFDDVTVYETIGDTFSADEVNQITTQINENTEALEDVDETMDQKIAEQLPGIVDEKLPGVVGDNFIQEEFFIAGVTVSANNIYTFNKSVYKEGYKPLAVTMAGVDGNTKCALRGFRLIKNSSMFTATVVNPTSASQSNVGLAVGILYMKEG